MSKFIRLRISDTAYEALHTSYMKNGQASGLEKGDYAKQLIIHGIKALADIPSFRRTSDIPRAGSASVSLKKSKNYPRFHESVMAFRSEKNFYDWHVAARALLYHQLGLPWDRADATQGDGSFIH